MWWGEYLFGGQESIRFPKEIQTENPYNNFLNFYDGVLSHTKHTGSARREQEQSVVEEISQTNDIAKSTLCCQLNSQLLRTERSSPPTKTRKSKKRKNTQKAEGKNTAKHIQGNKMKTKTQNQVKLQLKATTAAETSARRMGINNYLAMTFE